MDIVLNNFFLGFSYTKYALFPLFYLYFVVSLFAILLAAKRLYFLFFIKLYLYDRQFSKYRETSQTQKLTRYCGHKAKITKNLR